MRWNESRGDTVNAIVVMMVCVGRTYLADSGMGIGLWRHLRATLLMLRRPLLVSNAPIRLKHTQALDLVSDLISPSVSHINDITGRFKTIPCYTVSFLTSNNSASTPRRGRTRGCQERHRCGQFWAGAAINGRQWRESQQ